MSAEDQCVELYNIMYVYPRLRAIDRRFPLLCSNECMCPQLATERIHPSAPSIQKEQREHPLADDRGSPSARLAVCLYPLPTLKLYQYIPQRHSMRRKWPRRIRFHMIVLGGADRQQPEKSHRALAPCFVRELLPLLVQCSHS